MTSIVTMILSSTVGILWNKARDVTARKLKDGDITEEKIREIVIRELNDIKSKLDGLSRKDLLSSYGFLKEGVNLLKVSLDKANEDGPNAVMNESRIGTQSNLSNDAPEILNETLELSRAVDRLKSKSGNEFESAKERFKEARKTATHAFYNEGLIVKDRIFAAKLRVCSEMLECLESPETAVIGCETFLQDLHSLPAIREIFSVFLKGGFKSMLSKAERMENVKSVMMINYALYQFHFKFCRDRTGNMVWPGTIEISDRSFNPILNWQEVSTRKSWRDGPMQPQNKLLLHENIRPYQSALNSHGDIVAVTFDGDIKMFSRTGESRLVVSSDLGEDNVIKHCIKGLAVDNNDNIYVIRCLVNDIDGKSYVLYVFDSAYQVKHRCRLDFLEASGHLVNIAISNTNDIIMIKGDAPNTIYVCDNSGKMKFQFQRDSDPYPRVSMNMSNENEIIISANVRKRAIHMYTIEGKLKKVINLPEEHRVLGVTFNQFIFKIFVLSFEIKTASCFLLCYSKTGDIESSTFFSEWGGHRFSPRPNIVSNQNVPIAVVWARKIIYM